MADFQMKFEGHNELRLGGEGVWRDQYFLRLGYRLPFEDQNLGGELAGFSGGLGFLFDRWRLDYAFGDFGDLGATHRISLMWRWGKRRIRRIAQEDVEVHADHYSVALVGLKSSDGMENRQVNELIHHELGLMEAFDVVMTGTGKSPKRRRLSSVTSDAKGSSQDPIEFARELGTDLVVFGKIRERAESMVVSVKLAEVSTGRVLAREKWVVAGKQELRLRIQEWAQHLGEVLGVSSP